MTPTNRLRWIERTVPMTINGDNLARVERVLQQWWLDYATGVGEWRDVPLEAE